MEICRLAASASVCLRSLLSLCFKLEFGIVQFGGKTFWVFFSVGQSVECSSETVDKDTSNLITESPERLRN